MTSRIRTIFFTSNNKVISSLFLLSSLHHQQIIFIHLSRCSTLPFIFFPHSPRLACTYLCLYGLNNLLLWLNQSFVWICLDTHPSTSSICPKLISDIEGGFGPDLVRFSGDPRSITLGIRGGINIMKTKDSGFSGKIWRRPRPARKLTRRAAW